jgi:hypothetical protein
MYDMFFCFPDEATAHAVLDQFGLGYPRQSDGEGGFMPASWNTSICLPVTLSVERKVGEDENGQPIIWPVADPRFWLAISYAQPNDALYAIPYCMREADRDIMAANVERRRLYAEALKGAQAMRDYGMEVDDPPAPVDQNYVTRERFTAEQLAHPWSISPQWAGVDYSNPGASV